MREPESPEKTSEREGFTSETDEFPIDGSRGRLITSPASVVADGS